MKLHYAVKTYANMIWIIDSRNDNKDHSVSSIFGHPAFGNSPCAWYFARMGSGDNKAKGSRRVTDLPIKLPGWV